MIFIYISNTNNFFCEKGTQSRIILRSVCGNPRDKKNINEEEEGGGYGVLITDRVEITVM